MIAENTSQSRPHFYSADDWLQHYEECRASGHQAWEPATRAELILAESSGLLASHPEWLPGKLGLRMLDLPPWFGRKQEPLPELWQERFVQTLIDHPKFIAAIRSLIAGGQTNERN